MPYKYITEELLHDSAINALSGFEGMVYIGYDPFTKQHVFTSAVEEETDQRNYIRLYEHSRDVVGPVIKEVLIAREWLDNYKIGSNASNLVASISEIPVSDGEQSRNVECIRLHATIEAVCLLYDIKVIPLRDREAAIRNIKRME